MISPLEEQVEKEIETLEKSAKMQVELNKYGKKTRCGGTVWTASDLAGFFLDQKKRR